MPPKLSGAASAIVMVFSAPSEKMRSPRSCVKVIADAGIWVFGGTMHRAAILSLALLAVAGCAFQRAQEADQAKHQMVGMSKEQVLACMGPPAQQQAAGATEVWAYPSGGSTHSVAVANAYTSGSGAYSGTPTGGVYSGSSNTTALGSSSSFARYCVVDIVFSGDTVAAVNYQGRTGGLLTQGAECAYAVQNCIH
jgi:hypothetical protein